MKRKEVPGGFIEYKIPNVAELFILLGEMGYSTADLSDFGQAENGVSAKQMIFTGKLIQQTGRFVEKVEVVRENGEKASSFNDLLKNSDFVGHLTEIGMEMLSALEVSSEKKF